MYFEYHCASIRQSMYEWVSIIMRVHVSLSASDLDQEKITMYIYKLSVCLFVRQRTNVHFLLLLLLLFFFFFLLKYVVVVLV